MNEAELGEGWAYPNGGTKAHYFVIDKRLPGDRATFSLCSKYGFFENREALDAHPEGGKIGKRDCAECGRKVLKRLATTPVVPQEGDTQ